MSESISGDLPIVKTYWDYARGTPFDSYINIDPNQRHGLRTLAEARMATDSINELKYQPNSLASELVKYIFMHSPMVLDLPPRVAFRYNEAQRVMGNYPNGEHLLNEALLQYFSSKEALYEKKRMYASTSWVVQPGIQIESIDHEPAILIYLPEQIAARGIACSRWCQSMIKNGEGKKLFNEDPLWTVVKLGSGAWLPVGNLMAEVCQGVPRIQSPTHDRKKVIHKFGFARDIVGPREYAMDPWVVMTHIVDKKLLDLLEKIGIDEHAGALMIEDHKLNVEIYCRSYPEIIDLMHRNPLLKIRGVLSDGTWIYWSGNEKFFPHQEVMKLHRVAGKKVVMGTAEELGMEAQVQFATMNPERRAAYDKGEFPVTVVARFIDEPGMVAVTQKYGNAVAKEKLAEVMNDKVG